MTKKAAQFLFYLAVCATIFGIFSFKEIAQTPYIPIAHAIRQPLKVEVKTVGELEAAAL